MEASWKLAFTTSPRFRRPPVDLLEWKPSACAHRNDAGIMRFGLASSLTSLRAHRNALNVVPTHSVKKLKLRTAVPLEVNDLRQGHTAGKKTVDDHVVVT